MENDTTRGLTVSKRNHYEDSPLIKSINELGCCGCGDPDITYKAIHEMLIYFNAPSGKKSEFNHFGCDHISDNAHVQFMAYILDYLEFIEHGSSINHCWLTNKGDELLENLSILSKYNYDIDSLPFELKFVEVN